MTWKQPKLKKRVLPDFEKARLSDRLLKGMEDCITYSKGKLSLTTTRLSEGLENSHGRKPVDNLERTKEPRRGD